MRLPVEGSCRVIICCYDLSIGGFSSHAINLGLALRRRGYHVGALVTEPFGELADEFRAAFDDLTVIRRGWESRNKYLRRLITTVRRLDPHVVINNVVPFVQAAFPYLAPKTIRITVVHSMFGTEAEVALSNAAFIDAVVAVSDNILEKLQREGTNSVKIVAIPVAVEVPFGMQSRMAARDPLRLIFVGRLEAAKNVPALVRIGAELRRLGVPFELTVVGDGTQASALCGLIREAGLQGEFTMTGALDHLKISRILDEHDFFLMTSHYEGTPHALLEAMAHGLVALAAHIPGSTDRIITHGVDGFLCDRHSHAEYVGHLRRLHMHADEFASVSGSARETIASRFGVDRSADQYEALFRSANGASIPGNSSERRIDRALIPLTTSFRSQIRHRIADVWRWVAHGKRRITVR